MLYFTIAEGKGGKGEGERGNSPTLALLFSALLTFLTLLYGPPSRFDVARLTLYICSLNIYVYVYIG
jgi:hypothetical protein